MEASYLDFLDHPRVIAGAIVIGGVTAAVVKKFVFNSSVRFPGPSGIWPLGNLLEFKEGVPSFGPVLLKYSNEFPDTHFVQFHIMTQPILLINSSDAMRQIFIDLDWETHKLELVQPDTNQFLKDPLVFLNGNEWKKRRIIVNPLFSTVKIAAQVPAFLSCIEEALNRWEQHGYISNSKNPLNVIEEMKRLTLNNMCLTILGIDIQQKDLLDKVNKGISGFISAITDTFTNPLPKWLDKVIPNQKKIKLASVTAELDAVILEKVKQVKEHLDDPDYQKRVDLLHQLVFAQEKQTGERLDDLDIINQLKTFLLAGTETTANAMSWCLYMLACHPEYQSKLCKEIDDVLAGRDPTYEDLASLPYLSKILKETQRMYPAAPFGGRTIPKDLEVCGQILPKGTHVVLCTYVMHFSEKWWKDPYRFNPERFVDGEQDPFAFQPFSLGPRNCVGFRFALVEMKITLARFFQKCTVKVVPGKEKVLPDASSFTYTPANLYLFVNSR